MSTIAPELTLRSVRAEDAETLGRICYDAFVSISTKHNFPPDFPSAEVAIGLLGFVASAPGISSFVAEKDGKIVGSDFLWESPTIGGVGPVTVDPNFQDGSVGKLLMEATMNRAAEAGLAGVRLVQAAFHGRSMALYTKLGFEVKEPLICMNGPAVGTVYPAFPVRAAGPDDAKAASEVCFKIHGHDREGDFFGGIHQQTARVVEHEGRIVGYTTGVGFMGHTVAESNDGLKALIADAKEFSGPGFLLPSRNAEMFRWCLENGLKIVQPLTLMAKGLYNEPRGAFLPSILY